MSTQTKVSGKSFPQEMNVSVDRFHAGLLAVWRGRARPAKVQGAPTVGRALGGPCGKLFFATFKVRGIGVWRGVMTANNVSRDLAPTVYGFACHYGYHVAALAFS